MENKMETNKIYRCTSVIAIIICKINKETVSLFHDPVCK